jgi:hypothetical protein
VSDTWRYSSYGFDIYILSPTTDLLSGGINTQTESTYKRDFSLTLNRAFPNNVRFLMASLVFFMDIILPAAPWSWGRLDFLTEMRTRNISWGIYSTVLGVDLTNFMCRISTKFWESQPPGALWACLGLQ